MAEGWFIVDVIINNKLNYLLGTKFDHIVFVTIESY